MRIRLFCIFLCFIALALEASSAIGECLEPDRPSASMPQTPHCEFRSCPQSEIEEYKRQIDVYLELWRRYSEAMMEYLNCEQQRIVDDWNRFVKPQENN